jgi:DNA-binding LytR/AlgR family response regulator
MHFAKHVWDSHPIGQHVLIALALGVLFAVLGPFGSYPALAQSQRYGFWVFLVLFGYFCVVATVVVLDRNIKTVRSKLIARLIIATVGSAIPTTFATAWALSLVQPGRVVSVSNLPALFAAVACVQLVLAFVNLHLPKYLGSSDTPASGQVLNLVTAPSESVIGRTEEPARIDPPPFLARIPMRLGSDLLAVEAEDHYLRIHTSLGSELIHMRMTEAVEELRGIDGFQVHRSWWIARNAVCEKMRDGSRMFLALTGGLHVPVSRTFLQTVRTAHLPNLRSPT